MGSLMNVFMVGVFPHVFDPIVSMYVFKLIFQVGSCLISMTFTPFVDKMKLIVVGIAVKPNPTLEFDAIALFR